MIRGAFLVASGLALLGAAALSCSASRGSGFGGNDGTGASGGVIFQGGSGGGIFQGGNGGEGAGCSEEAKLVYVVGTGNELYSFHPPTLAFQQVGIINCPGSNGATPFSMAVDRSSMAWVLFNDGQLFKVDIVNGAACTSTNYLPNQVSGFNQFGMGFVSDTPGGSNETLYLGSYDGVGIARFDFQSMTVVPVGAYDLLSGAAEMTGTGDARLFGFFLSTPTLVAEIDKTNGHILSQAPQPTVDIGSAWAFAFWGGDFWLFTCPNMASSQVDQYRPSTQATTTVVTNVGFEIVGAGVSTCAPVEPPT